MTGGHLIVICVAALLTIRLHVSSGAAAVFGHEDPRKNAVQNWGFESNLNGWSMSGCRGARSTQAKHTGRYGLHVTNRVNVNASPVYKRSFASTSLLKPNTDYYVSAFVKLLNTPVYTSVTIRYRLRYANSGSNRDGTVGRLTFQFTDGRWKQVGGDFRTPSSTPREIEIYLQVIPESVNYYVDSVALTAIKSYGNNWNNVLAAKINQHRTSPVRITTRIPSSMRAANVRVNVALTRHEFGFGTAVKAHNLNRNDALNQRYKNFIKSHFNWAVFENDMKWKSMEQQKGNVNYRNVDPALTWLRSNGIKVRGHTIVWGTSGSQPNWLLPMRGSTLKSHVMRRVDYMMTHYKNKIFQWDLYNEYLNTHYYEHKLGLKNLSLLKELFQRAKSRDSSAELCLNDYAIARTSLLASSMLDLALTLKAARVPVKCIGIQSHLRELPISVERLAKRIEIVAKAGLPIVISEFSVHGSVSQRAAALDKAFKVYFSQPSVKGIVLWGFSDQPGLMFDPRNAALTTGSNFAPNAAGNVMLNLIHNKWATKLTYTPANNYYTKSLRAFHGQYKVTVSYNGRVVKTQNFSVVKGRTASVSVQVPTTAG